MFKIEKDKVSWSCKESQSVKSVQRKSKKSEVSFFLFSCPWVGDTGTTVSLVVPGR